MARWISAELRQAIADRASLLCEYCLIAEADTFYGCEVDHIISLKHGGSSEPENLAYARAFCNRAKGSEIGSISTSGEFENIVTDDLAAISTLRDDPQSLLKKTR